ncbi:DUF4440 domain-containing protein [Luteimonas fraxinea]|uniref:nuclear transport factor 2 family protein n=1 Tax=Luteimonas fraxinea TaxID=2901869 RepID=UPI001E4FD7F3|nr:nuclear transport factor 2 family protein [Luteimonas fraxinea]MCD9126667.1 nuclear transport factor 2 family protein [Luteimonas fraxinea]
MDAGALQTHLEALERALLDPAVRADRVHLDGLIAEDFLEIGASGAVFGKADVLARLPGETGVAYEALPMRVQRVGADIARVLYTVRRDAGGEVLRSLRSSWWRLDADGCWRMVFHQGTPDTGAGTI